MARAFGLDRRLNYEEFVCLYCNAEWDRVKRIIEAADAVRIAIGKAIIPPDWIDLLTDDPKERTMWRTQEWLKELPHPG